MIYLDNNATTSLDPRVLDVVLHSLCTNFGNPSSAHQLGQRARQALNRARRTIASYLSVRPQEIIFTSGGTEGANMILQGMARLYPQGHIITSSAEHSCVFATASQLQKAGQAVSFLKPGMWGAVRADAVRAAIRSETKLISLIGVNNETGVKTDIEAIAQVAREADIPFMVDGVAMLGKEPFSIPSGVTAMCFSGHKLHAPKGVGFVFLRGGCKIAPLLIGGGQEFGKRGGTENVAGILGIAEAVRLLESELPSASKKMCCLRDQLQKGLLELIPQAVVNGEGPRVVNTLNMSFPGIDGESLLIALDQVGVAASYGSACASGSRERSRILAEMDIPDERARSAMRFSLSRMTTEEEIQQAIILISQEVKRLRKE